MFSLTVFWFQLINKQKCFDCQKETNNSNKFMWPVLQAVSFHPTPDLYIYKYIITWQLAHNKHHYHQEQPQVSAVFPQVPPLPPLILSKVRKKKKQTWKTSLVWGSNTSYLSQNTGEVSTKEHRESTFEMWHETDLHISTITLVSQFWPRLENMFQILQRTRFITYKSDCNCQNKS